MPQDHRLQAQRFELKYLVPEEMVAGIRDFVRCYLELDDFSAGRANNSYDIHSVYLDSADLHTCQATRNGDKNRFKLRLRYYNDDPQTPVFFEIKQRVDNAILKQRCPVRREAVPLLMSGQLPDPEHLFSEEPRHLVALQRFQYLQYQLGAVPRMHNNYLREAWVPVSGNAVRVTFDRNIRIEPYFAYQAPVAMARPRRIYEDVVVLELKFTGRFPNWLRELADSFNLSRGTASKYCGGVDVLGDFHFRPRVEDLIQAGTARQEHYVGASSGTTMTELGQTAVARV
ncbi:MAG TPA: polyphosphate polymerase domain-containing protein [Verrucomicrobiae bacterium]|nr:polyphosphate polymerase domain-containing protein [Verrucomicrobiae bacterium]